MRSKSEHSSSKDKKLPATNGGGNQMSGLNMEPESESHYGWRIPVYPSSVLEFLICFSPIVWMTPWQGASRENITLFVEY